MSRPEQLITQVAVAKNQALGFVGVTFPLSNGEINTMQWGGVLDIRYPINQVVEFDPPSTVITVAGAVPEHALIGVTELERHTIEEAKKIAAILSNLRPGEVRCDLPLLYQEPIKTMTGLNSSPFYTDTNVLRPLLQEVPRPRT